MTRFKFNLARVLQWYEKQFQLEENRLADCHMALSRTKQALAEVKESRSRIEHALLHSSSMSAGDLRALEEFRYRSRNDETRLGTECVTCQGKIAAQLEVCKLAQRKVRLLEKLRERQLTEHDYAVNRELEELASETFLSKFARER